MASAVQRPLPWFSELYQKIHGPAAGYLAVAAEARVCLLVSGALAASFHVPQSLVALAVLGENLVWGSLGLWGFLLALFLACAILSFSVRIVLHLAQPEPGARTAAGQRAAETSLPWLVALLPLFSAFWAARAVQARYAHVADQIRGMMWAEFAVLAGVWVVNRWLAGRRASAAPGSDHIDRLVALAGRLSGWVLGLGLVFFAICIWSVQRTTALGPLAVCCLGATVWCTVGCILTWYGERIQFPVLNFALLLVLACSFFDWNDNHFVRDLRAETPAAPPPPVPVALRPLFADWLARRPDRARYAAAGQPYPVFVVSAQGGGIYAMQFTALMLAELQAKEPAFADHVFAISGVSGGSAGALVFAALADQRAAQPKLNFPDAAREVLANDFLSPVIASALFPDLLQQGLPKAVFADRASALEGAFELAWRSARQSGTFEEPFHALGRDFASRSVPLLLLNTTQVETGRRVVISSVPLSDDLISAGTFLHQLKPGAVLRASTAASLSARFPYVTPVASLELQRAAADGSAEARWKIRLADGGYFDNSGTSTLRDLIRALRGAPVPDPGYRIIAITLGTTDESVLADTGETVADHGLGELLSPVRTMLNTRPARSITARRNLLDDVSAARRGSRGTLTAIYPFSLDVHQDSIPLGWLLSDQGRLAISTQVREKWTRKPTDDTLDKDPRLLLDELTPLESYKPVLPERFIQRAAAKAQ